MTPNSLRKPIYVYDEHATLETLLAEFFGLNQNRWLDTARAIGVKRETLDSWILGTMTKGLLTTYAMKFTAATGIDLDRLLVLDAKRAIWTRDPSLRGIVTLERFQTRSEIAAEIARLKLLPMYGGTRMIAWQLGIAQENLVNRWSLNADKINSELPVGENLERCVEGLSRGLIETGTRNDLALRFAVERVCGCSTEACVGVSTFDELVQAVLDDTDMRERDPEEIANLIGISVNTVEALLSGTPKSTRSFEYETVLRLVRVCAERNLTPEQLRRFHQNLLEFKQNRENGYAVTTPVFSAQTTARNQPTEREETMKRVPRANAPETAPARKHQTDVPPALDPAILAWFVAQRNLLSEAAKLHPELAKLLVPAEPSPIGETLDGIPHCFTGKHMPDPGDWRPTKEYVRALALALETIRRETIRLLALPNGEGAPIYREHIERQVIELVLAVGAFGIEDKLGFAQDIVTPQRTHATTRRKGKN